VTCPLAAQWPRHLPGLLTGCTCEPDYGDHVAGFARIPWDSKRRHLIEHGRRLDLIGPLDGHQMTVLHAMLHAGPPEGCADVDVAELPGCGSTRPG